MRRTTQPSPSTQRRRRGRLQPGSSSTAALETDDVVAGSASASFVGLTEAVERVRSCCTGAAAAGASGTRSRVEPNRRAPAAVRSPAWEKRYVTGCPPVPGVHAGFIGGLGETIPKAQFCFGAMAHNMSNGKQKLARLRKAPAAGTRLPWRRCRCSTAVVQRFCKPKVGSSILSTGTSNFKDLAWGQPCPSRPRGKQQGKRANHGGERPRSGLTRGLDRAGSSVAASRPPRWRPHR